MTHFADTAAPGVSCRHRVIMPKVPILSRTPTSSTEVPGRATAAVSGSHVCTGTMGALIANATMKVTKMIIWMTSGALGRIWASVSMRKNVDTSCAACEPIAHR